MKKFVTLFSLIPSMALAQSLVSTTPENRTALLEEFTGIHCGYCPEGHAIAASLEGTLSDQFVTISVHAGGYAVPGTGEPDFRTVDGAAIDAQMAVTGYPAGTVDRHALAGALSYGRGSWEGVVNDVLTMPSPVNVGVESSFNDVTRELTVHAVGLYTAESAVGNDFMSVLLKENHITGWQTDYGNGDQPNYDHMAVLRDHITDTWGEDIGSPTAGTLVERTYSYIVPIEWNITNCQVVAFIGEYQTEVYQAREIAAVGGSTLVIGAFNGDAQPFQAGSSGSLTTFNGTFSNSLGAEEQYILTLNSYGSPASWSSEFTVDGTNLGNPVTITVPAGGTVDANVQITPDGTPGIGKYTLVVTSLNNSGAPALETVYHVISGVHDLVVTNPQAEPHEELYLNGLAAESARAFTTRADFVDFGLANALVGVNNLYLNISWTFPSYTDEVAGVLSTFMDNGGNLMIAGQDIGWDQSGQTGAYGTPVTQAFYTDYLLADFVDDGTSADTQVLFDDADAVFGTVANTTIIDAFGGFTYPDRFTPIAPAVPIMRYNATKIGGLRAQTSNHKVVYFGIGPEQVADLNVAYLMVQLSHDWFYGVVSVEEFDAAMNSLGQAYPSPANDVVNIPVGAFEGAATLEVIDATGRLVMSQAIVGNRAIATLNTQALNNGLYSARLRTNAGSGKATTFEVLR
ncbi:MAG: Omp28-related outer membrane protein [Flavobacteriales bacterium]|nr:Omp28-related outer membrane protein [Flavobacteriales bacterium]